MRMRLQGWMCDETNIENQKEPRSNFFFFFFDASASGAMHVATQVLFIASPFRGWLTIKESMSFNCQSLEVSQSLILNEPLGFWLQLLSSRTEGVYQAAALCLTDNYGLLFMYSWYILTFSVTECTAGISCFNMVSGFSHLCKTADHGKDLRMLIGWLG